MQKDIYKHSDKILKQLPKGVFITVKDKRGNTNTMTIAWGHIGIVWSRPVFIAYVRYSRHTYDLLVNAEDYTINVPYEGTLKEALKIAGSKSGRDIDKFSEASLTLAPAKTVTSPIIKDCEIQIECKTIYTQTQEPALIDDSIKQSHYKDHDTHVMFYGQIEALYTMEDE